MDSYIANLVVLRQLKINSPIVIYLKCNIFIHYIRIELYHINGTIYCRLFVNLVAQHL